MKVDYIRQGDCLELMKELPDKSINLILCDLPYGTTASQWDKVIPADKLWSEYKRIIKDNGSVLLFASGMFVPQIMMSNINDYKYSWVWVKNNSTNFIHAKNRPLAKYEQILAFSPAPMGHASLLGERRMVYNPQGLKRIDKIKRNDIKGTIVGVRRSHRKEYKQEYTGYPSDVITAFPDLPTTKKLHTNQKPIELLEFLIKSYTNEGDVVLDNCMGSGSTCVAAKECNRHYIGYELEPKYFEIAKQRLEMG